MNCSDIQPKLDDFVDGILPEPAASVVAGHLRDCPSCRITVEELRRLAALAAELPRECPPEQDLWQGIAERIQTPPRGRGLQHMPFQKSL